MHDWEGKVIATMRINRPLCLYPLLAEAFGTLQPTLFGLELGLSHIIIQGITKAEESWTSGGMLICDIKNKLQSYGEISTSCEMRQIM